MSAAHVDPAQLRKVAGAFRIGGTYGGGAPYGTGHINDTFAVSFEQDGAQVRYILQRINERVFKNVDAVMDNIGRVTAHAGRRALAAGAPDPTRRALTLVPTRAGGNLHRDESGAWRCYIFIEGAQTHDIIKHPAMAREAARAFGDFQKLLDDLPGQRLHETIPFFHHTRRRFENLRRAVEEDTAKRASQAAAEIAFAFEREASVDVLLNLQASGVIPERVTHNDTKLNNVMIDDRTGAGICVIDLDTVMPGLALYDFGDMVRSATNSAAEDERDLSLVHSRLDIFDALAEGYLGAARGFLNDAEIAHLAFSGRLITFEIGMRFLTDFLQGDVYFKTKRPNHNLDRARNQFALLRSLEAQKDQMEAAVGRHARRRPNNSSNHSPTAMIPTSSEAQQRERIVTEIADTADQACARLAADIAAMIKANEAAKKPTVLGLATGSTPVRLYKQLIKLHREQGLSFKNVITFNLDEYYGLSREHPESYWRFMHEQLFNHIDIPRENVNVPDGTVPRAEVFAWCRGYEEKIRAVGGIDLQILGIGRTGHIGFNEPGSSRESRTRLVTLDSLTRRDAARLSRRAERAASRDHDGRGHDSRRAPHRAARVGRGEGWRRGAGGRADAHGRVAREFSPGAPAGAVHHRSRGRRGAHARATSVARHADRLDTGNHAPRGRVARAAGGETGAQVARRRLQRTRHGGSADGARPRLRIKHPNLQRTSAHDHRLARWQTQCRRLVAPGARVAASEARGGVQPRAVARRAWHGRHAAPPHRSGASRHGGVSNLRQPRGAGRGSGDGDRSDDGAVGHVREDRQLGGGVCARSATAVAEQDRVRRRFAADPAGQGSAAPRRSARSNARLRHRGDERALPRPRLLRARPLPAVRA
jgi:6-phosphogluconolactonase/glucosamine-6-phosphate isomerase/deaminase/Ser/Thr protein kinase RdoA (MazF antagonist)